MFILRDIILLVSYINQSGAINNVFIGVGVLLGLVWSCGYAVQGRFEPGFWRCLLYTSPSPRDRQKSRMPSSA